MTVSQQIIKQYTIYVHCGLTLNRFFTQIHHTHNQEPLSHSFTHSSTFTITELN